eukprot:scaffold33978_cov63-Attheya_sp.AAC.1
MREVEYEDGYTATLSVEMLEVLSAMPGFGEVGYRFVKMFRCKEGMRPFNGTVTTVLPKKKYIVRWDPPDGKSETLSHAVLKRLSLTMNNPDNSDDDSSTSSKSSHSSIASSDDSSEMVTMAVKVTTVKGMRALIRRP